MSSNPRKQGDVGVVEAIRYYTRAGYIVSVPMTEAARYDLIVDYDGKLRRVQCKTSTRRSEAGTFDVTVGTCGGNQSWGGTQKPLSKDDFDELFIWTSDDTCWIIPAEHVDGKTKVRVGDFNREYLASGSLFVKTKVVKQTERFCECGSKMSSRAKNCRKCAGKKASKTKIDWPSDEELQEMVNLTNFSQAAKMLGVSDNAVRKRLGLK